jgi:hypothetical protein
LLESLKNYSYFAGRNCWRQSLILPFLK